jgi:hypothetical protein
LGGKTHVLLETPPLWEKIHRAVTFDPTHISSLDTVAAFLDTLVIRSSLKDWQSMKKECIHARHNSTLLQIKKFC